MPVGARVVMWGKVGLHGRPVWVAYERWLVAEPAISPPPSDRKGPPRIHPDALAPTESGILLYGKVSLHAPRPCVAA
jgi:hypothetical protein